jgi:transcriptional regulator with XRE-family HTH domain
MNLEELVPFEKVLERHLENPEFRSEWERLAPARAVANSVIRYRLDYGLTQTALGKLLGMSQPAVARLESGEHLPTLPTLLKLAEALDLEILVSMRPLRSRRHAGSHERDDSRVNESVITGRGTSLTIAIR